jgi:thiamine biosynthesis lipoprotein
MAVVATMGWAGARRGWRSVGSTPLVTDIQRLVRVERSGRAFGATVAITALHVDADVAGQAAAAALAELDLVESVMSLYRPDSQLVRLNRDGRLDDPHPYLLTVLRAADDVWRRSDGAFDPSVQPLWKLYYPARGERRTPTRDRIAEACQRVDWTAVRITADDRIEFTRPGIELTLNGIAQGFGTDRALTALRQHGVTRAILDTGEIGALGEREFDEPWKVGIQHPREPEQYLSVARLAGRCLATSGDYATRLSDDGRLHHVFDPRTGESPEQLASVSVVAPTAMEADALSTALMVLGIERGERLLGRSPGVEALFCTKDGRTVATRGFPWADDEPGVS